MTAGKISRWAVYTRSSTVISRLYLRRTRIFTYSFSLRGDQSVRRLNTLAVAAKPTMTVADYAGRPVAHRKGKGWRGGFILSALESYIKLDLNKHFKVIRDLDLLPQILQSDWSGVFLQRFSGDLTLTPRSTAGVSHPKHERYKRC